MVPSPAAQTSAICAAISDTVTRLFAISRLIGSATTRDRYARAEMSSEPRLNDQYDIAHVEARHGQAANGTTAPQWLIVRLGKAITKRREFLRYCRSHRERIASNPEPTPPQAPNNGLEARERCSRGPSGSTIESTPHLRQGPPPTVASTFDLAAPQPVDNGWDDAYSVSTLATTVVGSQSPDDLQVPRLADFSEPGQPFECPYCRTIQRFNAQQSWR